MPREHNIFELKLVIRNLRIAVILLSSALLSSIWIGFDFALDKRELVTRLELAQECGEISASEVANGLPDYPVEDVYNFDEYIAFNELEANAVAENLVHGATVENVCGPLSIQLLKDLGYVDEQIPIKDFWYLSPWEKYIQKNVIEPAFPKDSTTWYRFDTSITKFDFTQFPLKEGDFIFLPYNHQCGGTFAHMIAVTRVEDGIPYTVTNYQTTDGWLIGEVPLYGIENSLFDHLTDKNNEMTIGTTGFCGFYLWRQGK